MFQPLTIIRPTSKLLLFKRWNGASYTTLVKSSGTIISLASTYNGAAVPPDDIFNSIIIMPDKYIFTLIKQGDVVDDNGELYTITGLENKISHAEIIALKNSAITTPSTDPNLISEWRFSSTGALPDDAQGSNPLVNINTVTHSSDSATNATPQDGSALFTAANSERLEISDGDQSGLDITGNLSILLWFKMTSLPSSDDYGLAAKHDFGSQRSYRLGIDQSSKKLEAMLSSDGSSSNQVTATGGTTLSSGVWYSAALVYNGSDMRIYLNGSLDSNGSQNPKTYSAGIHNGSAKFVLGGHGDNGGKFDGKLDTVRIYKTALSSTQVDNWHDTGSI